MTDTGKQSAPPAVASLAGELAEFLRWARPNRLIAPPWRGVRKEPAEAPAATRVAPPITDRIESASGPDSLERVAAEVAVCDRCRLARSRTRAVPGEGPADADLMVIGEGPGSREDETGRPFVGEAGQMLTRMLEAIGEPRPGVFIANIVKCRPPNNRDPEADEMEACRPFLRRQMEIIRPLAVLALGRVAAQALLRTTEAISRLRGKFLRLGEIEILPTFHPAYLLRNKADKKLAWEDLQRLRGRLAELRHAAGEDAQP